MDIVKIGHIAKYTFRELYKSKILLNSAFIGLGLLVVTFIAFQFTYGEPERIALDFGFGCLSLSSIAISIFLGVNLISKEVESRTVYMVISRPVKRYEFIVGKLLGFNFIVVLNVLILASMTLSVYFLTGGSFDLLILWNLIFIILESLLALLLVVLFSLVTTNIMSVFITLALYIVGQAISETQHISFVKSNEILMSFIDIYHFILPAFYKLNIKNYLLYDHHLTNSYLFSVLAYASLYSAFLAGLIVAIFNKKNLD